MKKFITILMSAVVALAMSACTTSNSAKCPMANCPMANCPQAQAQCPKAKVCPKCPYAKKCTSMKLTKDMFYKNGKFDDKAAIDAYVALMENLGYPVSENLRQNMWATDFVLVISLQLVWAEFSGFTTTRQVFSDTKLSFFQTKCLLNTHTSHTQGFQQNTKLGSAELEQAIASVKKVKTHQNILT